MNELINRILQEKAKFKQIYSVQAASTEGLVSVPATPTRLYISFDVYAELKRGDIHAYRYMDTERDMIVGMKFYIVSGELNHICVCGD